MQSVLICEPRSKTPTTSGLTRQVQWTLGRIEREWRQGSWSSFPDRLEHVLLRDAHLVLGKLLDMFEDHGSR
jgi:hypothetical protein